jgi:hypothetical protein
MGPFRLVLDEGPRAWIRDARTVTLKFFGWRKTRTSVRISNPNTICYYRLFFMDTSS